MLNRLRSKTAAPSQSAASSSPSQAAGPAAPAARPASDNVVDSNSSGFDGEQLAIAALQRKNEVIDELQRQIDSLQEGVQAAEQRAAAQFEAKLVELSAQLGVAQRAQKRAEGMCKDEMRQRERQIVSQAAELQRVRAELLAAQEALARVDAQRVAADSAALEAAATATSDGVTDGHSARALQLVIDAQTVEMEELRAMAAQQRDAATTALERLRAAELALANANRDREEAERQHQDAGRAAGAPNSASTAGTAAGAAATADVRAKDKQIVQQSAEIVQLRNQLAQATQRAEELLRERDAAASELALRVASQEKQRGVLEATIAELKEKNAAVAAAAKDRVAADALAKSQAAELQKLRQTTDALRAEVAQLQHHRMQHQSVIGSVEEKDARIVTLHSQTERMAAQIAALEAERDKLQRYSAEQAALAVQRDEVHIAVVQRKETQNRAMQAEIEELRSSLEVMRAQLKDKSAALEDVGQQLVDVTAQRDQEREAWRTRTAQSEVRISAERENAKVAESQRSKREEDLVTQINGLLSQNAALLQEKRTLEAQLAAIAVEGAEKRSSVQRLSLELEETKLRLQKLTRDYSRKCEEHDRLLHRMCDLEGSQNDGTTTSSRRLIGVLESLSVEVSSQLAEHLRLDYLRGGIKTAAVMINAFGLERSLALEVIAVLCKLMFLVRVGEPIDALATAIGTRENTIKRIVAAFAKAEEKWSSTERHAILERDTPAAAKVTMCGEERLAFLCAVARGGDGNTVAAFAGHHWIQANVCSFLPCVVRGAPFFAAHTLTTRTADGRPEGHTAMVALDVKGGTFQMLECEVSADRAIVVIVGGSFKIQVSKSTQSTAKLALLCRTKRDGIVHKDEQGGSGSGQWQWHAPEALPRDEAPIIQYTIRWDARHDGLVAEGTSAILPEISLAEMGMLNELYSGDVPLSAMAGHRSWSLVPPPPPMRRSTA